MSVNFAVKLVVLIYSFAFKLFNFCALTASATTTLPKTVVNGNHLHTYVLSNEITYPGAAPVKSKSAGLGLCTATLSIISANSYLNC